MWREMEKYGITENRILNHMLSNEKCIEKIDEYFKKIIGKGSYYTYKTAERKIMLQCSSWDKIVRLQKALKMVDACDGIRNVKNVLKGKELEDFRRSLRELELLGINPVTIPEELGIRTIPNLLNNFYELQDKKNFEKWVQRMNGDFIKENKFEEPCSV